MIEAYHLPGLDADAVRDWEVREYDGVRLRFPVLDPSVLGRLVARLRRTRAHQLRDRPVADVASALAGAAARLARPADPLRREAERALPAVAGYSPAMTRLVLDRMCADWTAPALNTLLRAEFDDPEVLDGFRAAPRRGRRTRVRAHGPELAVHFFAGNVPGVAVTSLIRSLLVKAATLGKTASGEPLLPVLFARALTDVDPGLADCLAVTYWPGGTERLEAAALQAADAVVVYGGREVVDDVRRRVPEGTRLVAHGPRLSFALVGRDALGGPDGPRTAEQAARAVATFDQQGCVSPHVIYVEEGGALAPVQFAELLAGRLEQLEEELPRGGVRPADAAAIRQLRGAAEFRALGDDEVRVFASEDGTRYTVIYTAEADFEPSCLNRLVWVKPLSDLENVVSFVRPVTAYLQTVGITGAGARRAAVAERLGRIGVSRVTSLERMPWPPGHWHHDGRSPLRELVRWVDLES